MSDSLKWMLEQQRKFSENFHSHDDLTESDRERLTLQFAASLQKEVGDILDGVNYRHHRPTDKSPDISKIMHESVDAFRYLLAILNVWNISPEDFVDAFEVREQHLTTRYEKEQTLWEGQPVIIVDVDDVLTPFKRECSSWVRKNTEFDPDNNSAVYYSVTEEMYMEFIDARQLKHMGTNSETVEFINRLYDEGYWIHLLTARPKDHLVCKYDTYAWLSNSGIKYHRISFSPEKYLWLARTDYFRDGKVVCAIDDSPKHATEYAKHGIPTLAPYTTANQDIHDMHGVHMYETGGDLYVSVKRLTKNITEEENEQPNRREKGDEQSPRSEVD